MNLPESEMSLPVMTWLDGLGYVPYVEVRHRGYWVDIVAMRESDEVLIAVEMKTSMTKGVIQQTCVTRHFADYSYLAVLAKPRESSLRACSDRGIGVLRVKDGYARIILDAKKNELRPGNRRRIIQGLRSRPPGGVAGKPTLKGEGPAQDCARRVKRWRSENLGSTWTEIYANVENHYANMKSMRGALTSRGLA